MFGIGLLPGLEARAEATMLHVDPPDAPARAGAGDTLLGLKYRVLDETPSVPALLGGLTLRLPTGDASRGLGAEGVDVGALVAVSKTLERLVLTANLGHTFVTRARDQDFWTLAVSADYRVGETWSVVAETVATLARAADTAVIRAGALWHAAPTLRFDGAIGVGLTRATPDVHLTVGVTFVVSD